MHSLPRFFTLLALLLAPLSAAVAAPSVTVTTPVPGSTVSALTSIAITFSEAVTGVDADDLAVNGDAPSLVSGAGAGPYTFTFTQPAAGTVNVDWAGDHGIVGLSGTGPFVPGLSWTYTLTDTSAPTVASRTPASGATVGTLTQAEIVFNEAVTGVDAADVTVNGAPASAVTGSGFGPYVFTFAPPAVGAVSFAFAGGHGIQDTAAVPNAFAGGSWSVTLSATGSGNVVLNEFLSANGVGLTDENGDQEDWIELYNPGPAAVNLVGWALTNDSEDLAPWVFPSRNLAAGAYLVVFASGKDRKPGSGNLHTNFRLNENGGYLALVSPASPRVVVSQFPPDFNPNGNPPVTEYPPQRTDYSYGPQTGGALRYFSPPKPNLANGTSTLTGVTPRVNASVGRGFFKDPFQLVLSCPEAGATIRYTTDFTEPTAGTGTLYSGPITISTTRCLRAVAFSSGKIASLPVTYSYLYLDQVLAQTNTPVGFPADWGTTYGTNTFPPISSTPGLVPADYEVDTDPLRVDPNNPGSAIDPVKLQRFKDGMRGLPLLSVTIPMADMFTATGLYAVPNVENKNFGYKKCAVEMILPDGSTAFSEICGISGHGNASRAPIKNPKHGFQLKFKGDYGAGSLSYKLYPDSPVEEFDDIILRPDFNSSWRHWSDDGSNGSGTFQRTRATRLHDAFVKDTFRDMGELASHHRFFHLFINGLYWGTYDFAEQPVDGFGKSYLGGEKKDYDVIHEGNVRAGDTTVYSAMTAQPATTTNTLYETMKGYLEITEFIDYMLLHFYIGHQDWGNVKNWYAIRRRASTTNPTQGKFQYIPWDDECTLLDTTVNRVSNTDVPSGLHTKLVSHAQYRLDFADRVQRSMIAPTGALTPAANIARWQKWQAVMDQPIVGESVRWGDYRRDVHSYQTGLPALLYTRENQWLAECARKTGTYFPAAGRPATVLAQLQTAGLYPATAAPEYRQNTTSGAIVGTSRVGAGFVVAMNRPGGAGTIYFTTDGNDPHLYYSPTTGATGASVAATAAAYTAPLTLNATTTIKSRILNGGVWSALNEATFTVGLAASPIRITEIMFNPPNANGGTAAEFIELQNTSGAAVNLGGWSMNGVEFVFPLGFTLGAGDRIVLASNNAPGTFASQYPGVAIAGYFGGSLDNGGERLAVFDPNGRTMVSVDYQDTAPWPTTPDGGGYSLEIIDANGDPDDPFNWQASAVIRGTPGGANSAPATQSVELSEVFATGADFIELHNKTGAPVAIGGWEIRGSITATIPGGTMLGANGYHVLNTTLPQSEGSVAIFTDATLGTRVDGVSWGNQIAGASIGRLAGTWTLCTPTSGAVNASTPTAPPSNLALNEWLANNGPGESDWLELYDRHATLPVALQGVFVQTSTQLYQIKALAFIAPLGWLQMPADEQPGGNHLDLKLDAAGTTLALLNGTGATIDSITFGAQAAGVTSGRLPDGTGAVVAFPGTASPGAANYVNTWTGPVLNEVLARNVSGTLAPWGTSSDWVELFNPNGAPFDLGGMKLGVANSTGTAWTIPAGTSIPANGHLAIWCESLQAPSVAPGPDLNAGFDLSEVSGALYLFNGAGQVVNSIQWGFQIPDRSIGRDAGVWKLLASATRGAANSAAAALGAVTQLRFNEWAAALPVQADWFELYNLDANPVALAGLYLTDDPSELGRGKFQVGPLSFIAGNGWVKWEADAAAELGRNHVSFTLDGDAEYLRLSNNDANLTAIDTVSFGAQSAATTQGRILDGQTIQGGLTPTPGTRNILPPAPSFTTHPVSQTMGQGSNVSFTVAATGSAPLTYQWKFNGSDLPGKTTTTLALNGLGVANDGSYTCVATNTAGVTTSNTATLTVQSTFAQWSALRGVSGATGDPDEDGLGNLAEFFHNLDPSIPANAADRTALPQVAIEPPTGTPQFLTLTYRKNARAILSGIEHQISLTLGGGTWGTVSPDATENLTPDPMTGDPRVRVKFGIAPGDNKKFLRLLLTP